MTTRNRETLRNYFGDGRLPTHYHFGDLIDSMLNMSDEGFSKSAENGLEVAAPIGHDALMSFYRDQRPRSVLWSMSYGGGQDMLHFQPGSASAARGRAPVLALDARGRVGVNTGAPRHAIDVQGVVASTGRRGTYLPSNQEPLLANGKPQFLTDTLTGCQAFEVMAGVGHPGSGRFALLHAIALNAYNPNAGWLEFLSRKKRIRHTHAYYGRRCDRLQLSWERVKDRNRDYRLAIRTGCDYGDQVRIKVFITQLWFDPTTQGREE